MAKKRNAEVIVVGTGPAGATTALELCRRGKQVVLLEVGRDDPVGRGIWHTYAHLYDKFLFFSRSKEGVIIDRSLTLGGSSAVFSGNAFRPTASFQEALGMNLEQEVDETIEELRIAPFPDEFMKDWNGTRRLMDAAEELDVNLNPQLKFINPDLCNPKCDACMAGCGTSARWTARDYVRKAQAWPHGVDLIMEAKVERVLTENANGRQQVVGVEISGRHEAGTIYAPTVILAAGGMSTPIILQRSGVNDAGKQFFMDPMDVTVGFTKEKGPWRGMTFTHACEDFEHSDHFIIGNAGGMGAWMAQLVRKDTFMNNVTRQPQARGYTMGMFTKIADENKGSIDVNGRISKPMTANDQANMRKGDELCRRILVKAGCEPQSISVGTMIGGHPGGTAAMGRVVDENFETRQIKNLYVCDTSVFPRSPGVPPVLTLIAMNKKWARDLDV